MTYTKFHEAWADLPDRTTPITAEAMDHIEAGVEEAAEFAEQNQSKLGQYVDAVVDFGCDPTGVSDSTAELQAAINAAPPGGTIRWAGIIQFDHITVSEGRQLRGYGYYDNRDATEAFGDVAYDDDENFGGSVLRCTATSGIGIAVATDGTVAGGTLADFVLIGPGSGTSEGLVLGTEDIGLANPTIDKVKVCNFSVGARFINVNEGNLDLRVRGCETGVLSTVSTNNNVWRLLEIQRCVDGYVDEATCLSNLIQGFIGQGNTGTSMILSSTNTTVNAPYFENVDGIRAIDVVGGSGLTVNSPRLGYEVDSILIRPDARMPQIHNPTSALTPTITVQGIGTIITGNVFGDTVQVVDSGTGTYIIDAYNQAMWLPPFARPLIIDSEDIGQGILTFNDGVTPYWQFYKINGNPALLLQDVVNERVIQAHFPGDAANTSFMLIDAVFAGGSSDTAGRPNAGDFEPGSQWYDTTLGIPIWTNGVAWRNAAGVGV